MTAKHWKKSGERFYEKNTSAYNALIFGAPAPRSMWAWAVYSHKKREEGIEFSLDRARKKAALAIRNAEFMEGMA